MFRNHIKIALRNLIRRKSYTLLNIIGLSTGIACVIFIMNWVADESSFDKHFSNSENLYRVVAEAGVGADRWHQSVTSLPLGTSIKNVYPEVVAMARLDKNDALVQRGNERFIQDDIILTDPDFFTMFDPPLLAGNTSTALSRPYKLVLTKSTSVRYFGDSDPIGKTLKLFLYDPEGTGIDYEITGIVDDPKPTSHFNYSMLGSISTIDAARAGALEQWGNNSYYTYLQLADNSSFKELENKLPQLIKTNMSVMINEYDLYYRFYLQPIENIYLHSNLLYEISTGGSIEYIWIFTAVGLFIILLAAINYINLSTSIALERSKEIGVRKVLGAYKSHIIRQHLMETLVLTMASLITAGLLVELFKPYFYELTGKYYLPFDHITLGIQLLALTLPTGIISGIIPAYFLAKQGTVSALKSVIDKNSKNGLRSALVTIQFTVTLIILVGLIIVQQQLTFVQSQDLGYDRNNLLTIKVNGDLDVINGFQAFKTDLLSTTGIENVTRSGSNLTDGLGNGNGKITDNSGNIRFEKINRLRVDDSFIETMKLNIAAGRNFSPEVQSDTTAEFIINEKAAQVYGWSALEAIGKQLEFSGRKGTIIGVVNDFHFNSLHNVIEPVCMYKREYFSRIIIRGQDSNQLLSNVQQVWNSHFPSAIFDYQFQDQALADSYRNDARFGSIFNIFSLLSMLIAFLGLFGLVGYAVTKRSKEIGIRKVLGASGQQILYMLSHKIIGIIILASIIALPFSWYMMEEWLIKFPYRITIELWHFLIATLLLVFAAIIIIALRSMQTILTNPVKSLKEE